MFISFFVFIVFFFVEGKVLFLLMFFSLVLFSGILIGSDGLDWIFSVFIFSSGILIGSEGLGMLWSVMIVGLILFLGRILIFLMGWFFIFFIMFIIDFMFCFFFFCIVLVFNNDCKDKLFFIFIFGFEEEFEICIVVIEVGVVCIVEEDGMIFEFWEVGDRIFFILFMGIVFIIWLYLFDGCVI